MPPEYDTYYLSSVDILKMDWFLKHSEPNEALRLLVERLPEDRRTKTRIP